MARYMGTSNSTKDSAGGTAEKDRFQAVRSALTKENMSRNYYGITDHLWLGMNDIWWAILHPHKAIPRNIGQLTMIVVVASALGTLGYLFFGTPYTAEVDLQEPSSIFKVAIDYTVRPVWKTVSGFGSSQSAAVREEGDFDGQDYRR